MADSDDVPTCICFPRVFLAPPGYLKCEPSMRADLKEYNYARNAFANYLARTYWTAKSGSLCYGLRDLLDEEDQDKIDKTLKDGWKWITRRYAPPMGHATEVVTIQYKEKHQEVEGICVTIFSKYYGQICTSGNDYGPEGSDLNNLFKAYCTSEFAEGNENITVSEELLNLLEAASEAPKKAEDPTGTVNERSLERPSGSKEVGIDFKTALHLNRARAGSEPDSESEIEAEHPPKKLKTIDFQGFVSTPEIDGSDTEPELQTIAFQGFASTPEIEGEHPSKKKLTLSSKADTSWQPLHGFSPPISPLPESDSDTEEKVPRPAPIPNTMTAFQDPKTFKGERVAPDGTVWPQFPPPGWGEPPVYGPVEDLFSHMSEDDAALVTRALAHEGDLLD